MPKTSPEFGASPLLRLCGCPIDAWLAAGNPALFEGALKAEAAHVAFRQQSTAAALEIVRFVDESDAKLDRTTRLAAIDASRRWRRALHLRDRERCGVQTVVSIAPPAVGECLGAALRAGDMARDLGSGLIALLDAEPARIGAVAWLQVQTSPVLTALVSERDPTLLKEAAARLENGDGWEDKSMRRRGRLLWKILDRAATRTTPRDWHCQVAPVGLAEADQIPDAIGIAPELAMVWSENFHALRRRLADDPASRSGSTRFSLAPVYWTTADRLTFCVTDRGDPRHCVEVEVRRSEFLGSIIAAIAHSAMNFDQLALAAFPRATDEERDLLRQFVDHLLELGIVEASRPPTETRVSWHHSQGVKDLLAPDRISSRKQEGFLDVYRRTQATLPRSLCRELQRGFLEARRLSALIESGAIGRSAPRPSDAVGEAAVLLLDLVKPQLLSSDEQPALPKPSNPNLEDPAPAERVRMRPGGSNIRLEWPAAIPGSGYADLLAIIDREASAKECIDIEAGLLDAVGAPVPSIDWPIDYLVRLPSRGAAYLGVLEEAFPAGALDARFVAPLRRLEGRVLSSEAYEAFLDTISSEYGVAFVELLFPPLSLGAANAVRRPLYTNMWTGDPDIASYCEMGGRDPCFVPLEQIALRRTAKGIRAEVDGRMIIPMYHATRLPIRPWDAIADTLLSSAPFPMRWALRHLRRSLDAHPAREHLPRITVGGVLIVSCAQWRLPAAEMWPPDAPVLDKISTLNRWRRRLELPRVVFVSPGPGRQPTPCDLLSLRAFSILERAVMVGEDVLLIEATPSPEEFLVVDDEHGAGRRVASAFVLRLPIDESPADLAARVGPHLRA
jgi:hypothetical protein